MGSFESGSEGQLLGAASGDWFVKTGSLRASKQQKSTIFDCSILVFPSIEGQNFGVSGRIESWDGSFDSGRRSGVDGEERL